MKKFLSVLVLSCLVLLNTGFAQVLFTIDDPLETLGDPLESLTLTEEDFAKKPVEKPVEKLAEEKAVEPVKKPAVETTELAESDTPFFVTMLEAAAELHITVMQCLFGDEDSPETSVEDVSFEGLDIKQATQLALQNKAKLEELKAAIESSPSTEEDRAYYYALIRQQVKLGSHIWSLQQPAVFFMLFSSDDEAE